MVLVSVGTEKFTLGKKILLRFHIMLSHTFADHITFRDQFVLIHATAVDTRDLLFFVSSASNFSLDISTFKLSTTFNIFSSRVL